MAKLEVTKKWLSLFGHSCVFALNDLVTTKKPSKWHFDWSINHSLEEYVDVNSDSPYWLFFTPNWNLWKKNKLWQKLVRSKTDCEKYISVFYVDIDIKDTDYTSMAELKESMLEVILDQNLPVSYIMESGWWFHLYMFVERWAERKLDWIDFKKVQEEFAKRFEWWDLASHSVNKLMRLPTSNHWKTASPIPTKLWKVYKDIDEVELIEVLEADDIDEDIHTFLPEQYLRNLNDNLNEKIEMRIDMGWTPEQQIEVEWDQNIINKIEIKKVIKVLEKKNDKYPKEYWGYNYRFYIERDSTRIHIEKTNLETWEVTYDETSWYRINIGQNYVHNFSSDKHPISERPRWWTFSFLYHYFDKNYLRVKVFLEEEFWIVLKQQELWMWLSISTFWWAITFDKTWVVYHKESKIKGNTVVVPKRLFEIPIEIVWLFSSRYTKFWEAEEDHNYYVIKRLDKDDDERIIVQFSVDRKAFNKTYGSTWLMFFWNEEDMLSFYSALNKARIGWQIPTLEFAYLNWLKKDKLILGHQVFDKDFKPIVTDDLILNTQEVTMCYKWKTQISVSEFCEKFRKLFKDRVSILSFVTYITLYLWHDFWSPISEIKQQSLIPWMIVSWKTRAGKTTLISVLKEWSWLDIDTRKFSIKSTTAQPLKQAGTDSFLLHLEEFTWDIQPEKETIIRDILNKSITSRWNISGDNTRFVYRSSLILDWERLPTSQSVVNRTVLVPMFESDKIWNEDLLYDIKKYFFLPDILKKIMWIHDTIKIEEFKEAEAILHRNWIAWRNWMLYAFILATNNILQIIDNNLLLDIIKENFKLLWEVEVDSDDLSELLSTAIITNRIRPNFDYSLFEHSWGSKLKWDLTLTKDIVAEKRVTILSILEQYKWEIELSWYTLKINTDKTSMLWHKLLNYQQYFSFVSK